MKDKIIYKLLFFVLFLHSTLIFCQERKEKVYLNYNYNKYYHKSYRERGKKFYINMESFTFKNKIKDIDTLPITFLRKIKFVTIEELKEKERKKMLKIAEERERKWGTFFPKVTLYHDLFDVFIVKKIDTSRIALYRVKWVSHAPPFIVDPKPWQKK